MNNGRLQACNWESDWCGTINLTTLRIHLHKNTWQIADTVYLNHEVFGKDSDVSTYLEAGVCGVPKKVSNKVSLFFLLLVYCVWGWCIYHDVISSIVGTDQMIYPLLQMYSTLLGIFLYNTLIVVNLSLYCCSHELLHYIVSQYWNEKLYGTSSETFPHSSAPLYI